MIQEISDLLTAINPEYTFTYEESAMMNIKADSYLKYKDVIDPDTNEVTGQKIASFVYLEEFTSGSIKREGYVNARVQKCQLYFCKFADFHCDALQRQELRELMFTEIIYAFAEKIRLHPMLLAKDIQYYTPLPRFDANEVSVMIEFDYKVQLC
jgi:hypothetical protein